MDLLLLNHAAVEQPLSPPPSAASNPSSSTWEKLLKDVLGVIWRNCCCCCCYTVGGRVCHFSYPLTCMISTCYSEQPTAAELGGSVRRRWCGFLLSGDGGGRGVDGGEAPGAGDEVHHARRHGGGAQDLRPHHLHRDQPQGQAILPLRRIRAPHLWPRLRPRRPRRRHVHRHCRRRRCQDVDGQVLQDPRLLRRHRPHHRQGRLLHCRHRGWLQRPHQAHRQGPTPPRHRICY